MPLFLLTEDWTKCLLKQKPLSIWLQHWHIVKVYWENLHCTALVNFITVLSLQTFDWKINNCLCTLFYCINQRQILIDTHKNHEFKNFFTFIPLIFIYEEHFIVHWHLIGPGIFPADRNKQVHTVCFCCGPLIRQLFFLGCSVFYFRVQFISHNRIFFCQINRTLIHIESKFMCHITSLLMESVFDNNARIFNIYTFLISEFLRIVFTY